VDHSARLRQFLLLATTNHLCQNIAVVPFLWIIPLSIYLLSFILCFDHGHLYNRKLTLPLYAAALASIGYLLAHEVFGSLAMRLTVRPNGSDHQWKEDPACRFYARSGSTRC